MSVLETADLDFRIGQVDLINNVALTVQPSSMHAILGPNGAGKTTVLRLCLGNIKPNKGIVRLRGTPIVEMPLRLQATIRSYAGPTEYIAFPFTARELCLLGVRPTSERGTVEQANSIVDEVLELLDVSRFADRILMTLSSGEQERVLVARALAQVWGQSGERIVLLDEPTAQLDLAHQHITMRALRAATDRGIAVLMVVHDVNLASRYADSVTLLKDGEVLASGSAENTLTEDKLTRLFDIPIALVRSEKVDRPLIAVVDQS